MPRGQGPGSVDAATGAQSIVDYAHHEVHGGSAFHLVATTDDLGGETNDHLLFYFTTPAAPKGIHMIVETYASGQYTMEVREGATVSGGVAATPLNRRRNGPASSLTSVFSGGAVPSGGTVIDNQIRGSGSNNPGESRGTHEWVLLPETTYSFRVTDTTNIQAVLMLDWYEHSDKF